VLHGIHGSDPKYRFLLTSSDSEGSVGVNKKDPELIFVDPENLELSQTGSIVYMLLIIVRIFRIFFLTRLMRINVVHSLSLSLLVIV
jgi:hypothetical protein